MKKEVIIVSDVETLGDRAAEIFADAAASAISRQGSFRTAVSGGSTPIRMFSLLGTSYRDTIPWEKTEIFWVDERCVPKEHQDSNFRVAHVTWLSHVPIPSPSIHRIEGELDADEAARRYDNVLRETFGGQIVPRFNLIVLGVGTDGHTGSLFPGEAALAETETLVLPVREQPSRRPRVTLTLPVLNNAERVLFLASGTNKAEIVMEVLGDGHEGEACPASLVRPAGGTLTWLIDQDAASALGKPHGRPAGRD